jgi:hypothetical protein
MDDRVLKQKTIGAGPAKLSLANNTLENITSWFSRRAHASELSKQSPSPRYRKIKDGELSATPPTADKQCCC